MYNDMFFIKCKLYEACLIVVSIEHNKSDPAEPWDQITWLILLFPWACNMVDVQISESE